MADVLDLDADEPPTWRRSRSSVTISVRIPTLLASYVRGRVEPDGQTINGYLLGLIEADRDREGGGWPGDVNEWLLRQAAQCGCPGDSRTAVIEVVRHLADRWPDGGRLRERS